MKQLVIGVVVGVIVGSGATLGVQAFRAEQVTAFAQHTDLQARVTELERYVDIIKRESMQAAINKAANDECSNLPKPSDDVVKKNGVLVTNLWVRVNLLACLSHSGQRYETLDFTLPYDEPPAQGAAKP